jgi:hypothetical protein
MTLSRICKSVICPPVFHPKTVTPPPPRSHQLNLDGPEPPLLDSSPKFFNPTPHPDLTAARIIFPSSEINFIKFLMRHLNINPYVSNP